MRADKISRDWKVHTAFFPDVGWREARHKKFRALFSKAWNNAKAQRKNGRRRGFAPSALLGVFALKSSAFGGTGKRCGYGMRDASKPGAAVAAGVEAGRVLTNAATSTRELELPPTRRTSLTRRRFE
jgi:hypothetical protein